MAAPLVLTLKLDRDVLAYCVMAEALAYIAKRADADPCGNAGLESGDVARNALAEVDRLNREEPARGA